MRTNFHQTTASLSFNRLEQTAPMTNLSLQSCRLQVVDRHPCHDRIYISRADRTVETQDLGHGCSMVGSIYDFAMEEADRKGVLLEVIYDPTLYTMLSSDTSLSWIFFQQINLKTGEMKWELI